MLSDGMNSRGVKSHAVVHVSLSFCTALVLLLPLVFAQPAVEIQVTRVLQQLDKSIASY